MTYSESVDLELRQDAPGEKVVGFDARHLDAETMLATNANP
jgi:hypothetical protein